MSACGDSGADGKVNEDGSVQSTEVRPSLTALNREPYPSVPWRPQQNANKQEPTLTLSKRSTEQVRVVVRISCCYRSVLGPDSSQEDAFQTVIGPQMVSDFLNGTDCVVLAYGQTGSGKSHTMFGTEGCLKTRVAGGERGEGSQGFFDEIGVIPRAMMAILSGLPVGATLELSCVEIYCEEVCDLLDGRRPVKVIAMHDPAAADGELKETHPATKNNGNAKSSKISVGRRRAHKANRRRGNDKRSSPTTECGSKSFTVSGQKTRQLNSNNDILSTLHDANAARRRFAHSLNSQSSRSHCVVLLTMRDGVGGDDASITTFAFADLAGSERLKKSNSEGQHRREATTVNNSLTTLGRCVRSLAASTSIASGELAPDNFLPLRDSALTMLLSKALRDGRCCLMVTISPDVAHIEETMCSLKFGSQASLLRTSVKSDSRPPAVAGKPELTMLTNGTPVACRRTRKVVRREPKRRPK